MVYCNTANKIWLRISNQECCRQRTCTSTEILWVPLPSQKRCDVSYYWDWNYCQSTSSHDRTFFGGPDYDKIISTIPPSYWGFIKSWDSVAKSDRTMNSLTFFLLKEDSLAKKWNRGKMDHQNAAFFTRNWPSEKRTDSREPLGRGRDKSGRVWWKCDHFGRRQHHKRVCTYHRCNRPEHTIEVCKRLFLHISNMHIEMHTWMVCRFRCNWTHDWPTLIL